MEEAARIISKAFSSCVTDRWDPSPHHHTIPPLTRSGLVIEHRHTQSHGNGVSTTSLA